MAAFNSQENHMETINNNGSNFTDINVGSIPSISNSAMLVELNISTWTGRKLDKRVSLEVDQAKNTTTRAGNYNKKLFADEPVFDAITKFAGNARTYHYHATMPWSDSGLRLLTTAMFFDYQKQITALEAEFNSKVTEFINQYDKLVIQAQMKLGTLFDASDYPNAEDIASKYRFSVKYTPVPDVGDWRVNVGNEAQQLLKDSYAKAYTTNLTQAYADVWQRTYDALSNMSNKLSGNDKQIFRDSLVSNVRDMVALLDRFNITNDDKMRLAKVKIENALLGVTPDALREDDDFRLDTKTKVDALLKEFSW